MGYTVLRVSLVHNKDNPAAVEQKIQELIVAKYSGDGWVRAAPSFMDNKLTGESVNLFNEAYAILEQEGDRNDAVAVVQSPDGEERHLFVHQDAVEAAGGDLQILKTNLQEVLGPVSGFGVPKWVYYAGGAVLLLAVVRGMGGGHHSARHGRHG